MAVKPLSIDVIVKGVEGGCYLQIPRTEGKEGYETFLVLKKKQASQNDLLFKIPFTDVLAFIYKKPFLFGRGYIMIDTKDSNEVVSYMEVERKAFNKNVLFEMFNLVK